VPSIIIGIGPSIIIGIGPGALLIIIFIILKLNDYIMEKLF